MVTHLGQMVSDMDPGLYMNLEKHIDPEKHFIS